MSQKTFWNYYSTLRTFWNYYSTLHTFWNYYSTMLTFWNYYSTLRTNTEFIYVLSRERPINVCKIALFVRNPLESLITPSQACNTNDGESLSKQNSSSGRKVNFILKEFLDLLSGVLFIGETMEGV